FQRGRARSGVGVVPERETEIRGIEKWALFETRENHRAPAEAAADVAGREGVAHRKAAMCIVVAMHRETNLLELVRTARPAGAFPRRLDGREQEGDEHADDRDHHEELDERETAFRSHGTPLHAGQRMTNLREVIPCAASPTR